MKKKSIILLALSVALILAASINTALAYFTSYAEAKGGYAIELGSKTTIDEDLSSWTKRVTITNDPNSQPVFVRAKAFCGSAYTLSYADKSQIWTDGEDGYFYYGDVLGPGESTTELLIHIDDVPASAKDGDTFNVVVIYETTEVLYHEDGTPHADWTRVLQSEGGNK